MRNLKTVGIGVLIALTVLGVGYLWGARGRWAAEERLQGVERQAAFAESRRLTLAGQMSLTRLNFGEAAGLFESARLAAEDVARALDKDGKMELAGEATTAAQTLAEARALAAKLDRGAAGKGGEALGILDAAAAKLPGAAR